MKWPGHSLFYYFVTVVSRDVGKHSE